MNRSTHNLVACLALALAATVGAPSRATAQDPSPVAAYRQSIMQAFRLHMGGVRASLGDAAPAGHAEHHAIAFNHMAQALANAFPEGSDGPGSRALPAIWEDREGFMERVSAIQNATAKLVAAAQSHDADAIQSAASEVQSTCGACHNTYRAR